MLVAKFSKFFPHINNLHAMSLSETLKVGHKELNIRQSDNFVCNLHRMPNE